MLLLTPSPRTHYYHRLVDKIFTFSLVWGMGGAINAECWEGFDVFLREQLDANDIRVGLPGKGQARNHSYHLIKMPYQNNNAGCL